MEQFILRAKAACYVGDGQHAASSRQGSHDLVYSEGAFSYRDSYFGGTDFLGQEVVWQGHDPVWAMNYYGRILRDDLLTAAEGGMIIKTALAALYAEGRFLGGFQRQVEQFTYTDTSTGDYRRFTGLEHIHLGDQLAYRLDYHGGLIRA